MKSQSSVLRDFTVDNRVWILSGLAVLIGVIVTLVAVLLLRAIGLCTNLFYYHRFSTALVSPAGSPLGHWMVVVPILGGLLVGLMARFGSEKIRGHGMPEAIEAILINRARVAPNVAFFKPLSAAIAIGSGGPFGAEGPIIMTGGACGSLLAQWINLSDAERATLLVAGSAAGMTAVFSTPLAAILLAVELLLFEWRPRSLVPVAIAAATAGILRIPFLGSDVLFPMPQFTPNYSPWFALLVLLFGMASALLASGLSRIVYLFEDLFEHLPIHWMWWPAIGGVLIGVGGLIFPRGLGVGYDNIAQLLRGEAPLTLILGILLVKSIMWAGSLGSGSSGGVLAPLLMMGAAFGGLTAHFTHSSQPIFALLGMAAMLAASLGVPLTAIIFSLEVTHSYPAMLPLTIACMGAYLVAALVMPRSILTERISRRGYHITREYGIDPLEMVMVKERMEERTASTLPQIYVYSDATCRNAAEIMATENLAELPVLDRKSNQVVGRITLANLLAGRHRSVIRERERSRPFGA